MGAQHDAAWHEQRRLHIGGSDAAAACGVDPHKSVTTLYYEKTGELDLSKEENEFMKWGSLIEPLVAAEYASRTGRKVRRAKHRVSKRYPYMAANVDRMIVGDPRGPGVLECKCIGSFSPWAGVKNPDGQPDKHYLQMQHYLSVTGYSWGSFAYLVGGNKLVWFDVDRDQGTIDMLVEMEARFWEHVLSKTPPDMVEHPDLDATMRKLHPSDDGSLIEAGEDHRRLALEDASLAEQIAELESRRKFVRAQIEAMIGDATGCRFQDGSGYTWKANKPTMKQVVNMDLLSGKYPAIAAEVIEHKIVQGARVLRPFNAREENKGE